MSASNSKILGLAVAGLLSLTAAASASGASPSRPAPEVILVYTEPPGPIFDRLCQRMTGTPAQPAKVEELYRRLPEFQALWNKEGPAYIAEAVKATGKPFPYTQVQAVMTACGEDDLSIAMPLLISGIPYLAGAKEAEPLMMFPRLVFHEMMHTYTQPIDKSSAIRRKYPGEPLTVLDHLHVLALEAHVLKALGKKEELAWLDHGYRTAAPPPYKRAWEIVMDIEGPQALIDELKSLPWK